MQSFSRAARRLYGFRAKSCKLLHFLDYTQPSTVLQPTAAFFNSCRAFLGLHADSMDFAQNHANFCIFLITHSLLRYYNLQLHFLTHAELFSGCTQTLWISRKIMQTSAFSCLHTAY